MLPESNDAAVTSLLLRRSCNEPTGRYPFFTFRLYTRITAPDGRSYFDSARCDGLCCNGEPMRRRAAQCRKSPDLHRRQSMSPIELPFMPLAMRQISKLMTAFHIANAAVVERGI